MQSSGSKINRQEKVSSTGLEEQLSGKKKKIVEAKLCPKLLKLTLWDSGIS